MIDHRRDRASGGDARLPTPLSRCAARLASIASLPAPSAPDVVPLNTALVAADGTFSGYASLFDVPDLAGDVIAPGAFAASLARRGVSGVRLLYQHAAADPIGVWRILREDARGLYAEGQLTVANSRARDVLALLRSGACPSSNALGQSEV